MSQYIADILNTPEVRQGIASLCRDVIRSWGQGSLVKAGLGRMAGGIVFKTLGPDDRESLETMIGRPEFIEAVAKDIPAILHGMAEILLSVTHAVEDLPFDRKKALIDGLLSGRHPEVPGRLLAGLTRIVDDICLEDPDYFTSRLIPVLEGWIAHTDFGDLKRLMDTLKPDLEALFKESTGLLFEYPAKLIAILSLIPGGVNLAMSLVRHLLAHVTTLPPDVFTDLLLSLFRELDAKTFGQTLNSINDVIRRVHTGSTLIGEMDAPRFSGDLADKIRDIMAEIDPEIAIKARNALVDGRETFATAVVEAMEENPDMLNLWLKQLAVVRNSKIRLARRKISVLETLPEEDTVEALSAGLSTWNAYDLAETVNAISRMVNRVHGFSPGVIKNLVNEFVNGLDFYELEESLDWLARDLGRAIRPVFRVAAPPIIREFTAMFEPGVDDDGLDDAMDDARNRLRQWLLVREEA